MNRQKSISLGAMVMLVGVFLSACSSLAGVPASTASSSVPDFDHIIWIIFENRDYLHVIGSTDMPFINSLAEKNVLLTNYMAIRHPSLPNYLALIGGDTFGIDNDCIDCFLDHPSLPDLLEAAGRTWKTYQEDMPSACYLGNSGLYAQRHNPFVYFNAIRNDPERCQRSVVPFSALDADLAANSLPDFSFIAPNLCHDGHDCDSAAVDQWLSDLVTRLQASPALGEHSLIVVTYDETKRKKGLAGMFDRTGGQVPTILVSPLAKPAFEDNTPYTHYSLLKTLLLAWDLPELVNTKSDFVRPILDVWQP